MNITHTKPTPSAPILITGAHRTGTTWVGKMLCAGGGAAYVSEPLNVLHRPGVMRTPTKYWYSYICSENEDHYLPALCETLDLRYHTWAELRALRSRKDLLRMGRDWSIFMRGRLRGLRPLLKDPFAVFSAAWFAGRLGCQVVFTVRHPAAFASSLKRLDWVFDFGDLLAQPLLIRDWLEPFHGEMLAMQRAPQDGLGASCLLWRMVYRAVHVLQEQLPACRVVRHEDLSLDPAGGFRELYDFLGLAYNARAEAAVCAASDASNPGELTPGSAHAFHLDSRANLQNWKRRLEPAEIARVYELTRDVTGLYYSDQEWE